MFASWPRKEEDTVLCCGRISDESIVRWDSKLLYIVRLVKKKTVIWWSKKGMSSSVEQGNMLI